MRFWWDFNIHFTLGKYNTILGIFTDLINIYKCMESTLTDWWYGPFLLFWWQQHKQPTSSFRLDTKQSRFTRHTSHSRVTSVEHQARAIENPPPSQPHSTSPINNLSFSIQSDQALIISLLSQKPKRQPQNTRLVDVDFW